MPQQLNWEDKASHIYLNPRLHKGINPEVVERMLPSFPSHIWMATSGTTMASGLKLVALSKSAMLASAHAVNDHLQVQEKDKWLNVLPSFHVGGLAIYARGYVGSCPVLSRESLSWDPHRFVAEVESSGATLSSLVPTQVFDLVARGLPCPKTMRAIVVGGGALSESLYLKSSELGWPLLPSYGLTECCSQVATAPLDSLFSEKEPPLRRLSHVKLHTNGEGRLMISSESLLSAYAFVGEESVRIFDPRESGWFVTEDLAELHQDDLELRGRADERVKIMGELVDIFKLNKEFLNQIHHQETRFHGQLVANPHPRKGFQVDLVTDLEDLKMAQLAAEDFNKRVSGVERICHIYGLPELPRTPLGKIHVAQVKRELRFL